MSPINVIELRQYTLYPGQRDVLIELFDREFVESQEATGMAVLGQFRDLDDPDRFVWLRGFDDMPSRAEALGRFYGGPVWKEHRDRANATMIDSDNVLLLRPAAPNSGFPATPASVRPSIGGEVGDRCDRRGDDTGPQPERQPSLLLATIYYRDHPFDEAFLDFFQSQLRPVLVETGATPLACLQTEYAENTFPALPVRTGEHAFVWFARFPSPAELDHHLRRLADAPVLLTLSVMLSGAPQRLRLAPTARSLLR